MPASCGARSGRTKLSTIPTVRNITRPLPTILPPSSARFSPIFCPSRIVMPIHRLLRMLVIVIIIWDPVETADTSAELANFPTIRRSTAPYIACRNKARRTGPANFRSGPTILPLVKSILSSISGLLSINPALDDVRSPSQKKPDKKSGISTRHLIQLVISRRITYPPMNGAILSALQPAVNTAVSLISFLISSCTPGLINL